MLHRSKEIWISVVYKYDDIGFGNDFLDMTLKAQVTKEKRQVGLHEIKNFVPQDTIHKAKRQPTQWEKIFANHISDKGLISKIYIELLKLNNNNNRTT